MSDLAVRVRPATADDLPGLVDVWLSTEEGWSHRPPGVYPLYQQVFDTGRLLVAEVDGPGVVGFAGLIERDGLAFLTDLFVRPEHQSSGAGRRLLDALFGPVGPERCTMASDDGRAVRSYVRVGMRPLWPCYYLEVAGPRMETLAIGGLTAGGPTGGRLPVREGGLADAVALDRAALGRDRRCDLRHWCERLPARVLVLGDPAVGYAMVRHPQPWHPWAPDAATIAPVTVTSPEVAADAVLAALAWTVEHIGPPSLRLYVPGPHPVLPALFDLGFRISDTDTFCASAEALFDPTTRLPSPDLL